MFNNKLTWLCFGLLVLLQLWAPASMIVQRERVLKHGRLFKFRTAPVDPNDPFRGKYIMLRFDEASFFYPGTKTWQRGETVFIKLSNDNDGFAKVAAVSELKPTSDDDFVIAKVDYVSYDSTKKVFIEWPFDRFYLEESKALPAEKVYTSSTADSTKVTYAVVKVKGGLAVLEDVFINEKPIASYIKN